MYNIEEEHRHHICPISGTETTLEGKTLLVPPLQEYVFTRSVAKLDKQKGKVRKNTTAPLSQQQQWFVSKVAHLGISAAFQSATEVLGCYIINSSVQSFLSEHSIFYKKTRSSATAEQKQEFQLQTSPQILHPLCFPINNLQSKSDNLWSLMLLLGL